MRTNGTIAILAILLFLGGGVSVAKGGKKPKPPPAPVDTGVIYYEDFPGTGTWSLCEMEPDGSGKTALGMTDYPMGALFGGQFAASLALHGQERWFLMFRAVEDDAYPSTNPRHELFAVSESGTAVQLTDGETNDTNGDRIEIVEPNSWDGIDHDPRASPRWATHQGVADGKVSFVGGTWAWDSVNQEWIVTEYGIYFLSIDPDDLVSGSHDPARPTCLPVTLHLNQYNSRGLFANTYYSWSPDGTGIAYQRFNTADAGIWRAVLEDETWTEIQLTTDGSAPEWSPEPQVDKILFIGARTIETMTTGGADRTTVMPKLKKLDQHYEAAFWSPSATHIVYQLTGEAQRGHYSDIYRAEADGDQKTCLTRDVGSYARPVAWRE